VTKLISWVEIPALDMQRATLFYNNVLKLNMEVQDFGSEKMACFPSGEGAISQAPDFKPSDNGVLVSLNTEDDLDGTLDRITEHGGKVVLGKTKIEAEGRGYFSIFLDCEGNKLGLYGD